MNTPSSKTVMQLKLSASIDGISNQVSSISIGGSAHPSFTTTPKTEGNDSISWLLEHTPKAAVQSDQDYLSQELSPNKASRLNFPKLTSNGRRVRKWKLKTRSSCNISDLKPHIQHTNRAHPATPQGRRLIAAQNPPKIPRKITVIHQGYLPPPDLRVVDTPSLVYEDLASSLKPRPTLLFVSPQKKRRIS
eukprot:scaffold60416_cov81-Cyclotella_meneghiniana.AAC.8